MSTLIIGGGWSGLTAGVYLAQYHRSVCVLEAAPQLGGRARNVNWQGLTVDNGQHLLIGAYQETLNLLNIINAQESQLFHRRPLQMEIIDQHQPNLHLHAGKHLPWPLSLAWRLLRDNGFAITYQLSRLLIAARHQQHQHTDQPVIDWLAKLKQSPQLIRQCWEPLCLAMLNTPIAQASSVVFSRVLIESFKHRHHSDLLIPKLPLGDTVPKFAKQFIEHNGGQVKLQARVKKLDIKDNTIHGVWLSDDKYISANQVIIATHPTTMRELLTPHIRFTEPSYLPIATVYLQYEPTQLPEIKMITGLSSYTSQWLFDRSELNAGLVSVVISGPGEHERLTKQALLDLIHRELSIAIQHWPNQYVKGLAIREKRATFACMPDINKHRPNTNTTIKGLSLAGDFIANPYPATLEGAIINGKQAALNIMEYS